MIHKRVKKIYIIISILTLLAANATAQVMTNNGAAIFSNSGALFYGIDEERIIPILTKAMQEQQQIINQLNVKIENLEKRLNVLEKK